MREREGCLVSARGRGSLFWRERGGELGEGVEPDEHVQVDEGAAFGIRGQDEVATALREGKDT